MYDTLHSMSATQTRTDSPDNPKATLRAALRTASSATHLSVGTEHVDIFEISRSEGIIFRVVAFAIKCETFLIQAMLT